MALTIASVSRHVNRGIRTNVFDVTFDSSYASGGEALTLANLGLHVAFSVNAEPVGGYVFSYDRANEKLLAYVQTDPADGGGADVPLVEATGADMDEVVVRVTAVGR